MTEWTQAADAELLAALGEAQQDVLPGRGMSGQEVPAALPATAAAVGEGAVSAEHVRAIQATLAALPPHLEAHRAALEDDLVGFARTLDPDTVRKLGKRALAAPTPAAALTAEDARRYACDAHLVPIVLAATGEPLDIGRETRIVPRGMRRALAQRDGGCAFPGCECPAQWADAHHILHWANGGVTALHNLVLLCPRHHIVIHTGDWTSPSAKASRSSTRPPGTRRAPTETP